MGLFSADTVGGVAKCTKGGDTGVPEDHPSGHSEVPRMGTRVVVHPRVNASPIKVRDGVRSRTWSLLVEPRPLVPRL